MSAESVVYYLNRPEQEPVEDTEWLFSALSQFTGAELRELLYVAQEPEFFELMRGLFTMSDEGRSNLHQFLAKAGTQPTKTVIAEDGSCVLSHAPGGNGKTTLTIVS